MADTDPLFPPVQEYGTPGFPGKPNYGLAQKEGHTGKKTNKRPLKIFSS
jgi:hypothetical protein